VQYESGHPKQSGVIPIQRWRSSLKASSRPEPVFRRSESLP
jgi:hypothetical protein